MYVLTIETLFVLNMSSKLELRHPKNFVHCDRITVYMC
jgi:hypothetical protein